MGYEIDSVSFSEVVRPPMKENKYGNMRFNQELSLLDIALSRVLVNSNGLYCHPDYISKWTLENPRLGICITAAVLAKEIYGRNLNPKSSKWDSRSQFFVYWVYESEEKAFEHPLSNKIDIHYSFWNPEIGEIDLSLSQFPEDYYLHRRRHPGTNDWKPVTTSWPSGVKIPEKTMHLVKNIAPHIRTLLVDFPLNTSPQLTKFLERTSS